MTKVMVFGTFDRLHKGHLYLFQKAKEYGDYLIVVVGLDSTVKKVKDKEPVQNQEERVTAISSESIVDLAILGNEEDYFQVIRENEPDVICLGYDQYNFNDKLIEFIMKENRKIKIVRVDSFKPEIYKSSKMN